MKQLLIIITVITACMVTARAQKLQASQVPVAAKAAFKKQYPHAKVNWEREKGNYEANFKKDGKPMSAVIDKDGTVIETETGVAADELPSPVQAYMKEHYKGEKIKEAAKIVKANGEINYEAGINGKDVLFDADGKFIKTAKD